MNEAPKKIWIDTQRPYWAYVPSKEIDTSYIRADLVDELMRALESMVYEMEDYSGWKQFSVCKDARAALKALEEE